MSSFVRVGNRSCKKSGICRICGTKVDSWQNLCFDHWKKNQKSEQAEERKQKSIILMEKLNVTNNCRLCLHHITKSCTNALPRGCQDFYQTTEQDNQDKLVAQLDADNNAHIQSLNTR